MTWWLLLIVACVVSYIAGAVTAYRTAITAWHRRETERRAT